MRSEAKQVYLFFLSVVEYFTVRGAFAHRRYYFRTPQGRFRRDGALQTPGRLMIGVFLRRRAPGQLRVKPSRGRQHMQQMELRLIFLRQRNSFLQG